MSTAVTPLEARPRGATALNMFLIVRCHEWLAALDVNPIERIISIGDAELRSTATTQAPACLGVLSIQKQKYAAWDLGLLLGLGSLPSAWILARLTIRDGALPVALRTGTCMSVGNLSRSQFISLPPGIMRTRRKAIAAVFPISIVHARRKTNYAAGLKLDWGGLWSDEELALSRKIAGGAAG